MQLKAVDQTDLFVRSVFEGAVGRQLKGYPMNISSGLLKTCLSFALYKLI